MYFPLYSRGSLNKGFAPRITSEEHTLLKVSNQVRPKVQVPRRPVLNRGPRLLLRFVPPKVNRRVLQVNRPSGKQPLIREPNSISILLFFFKYQALNRLSWDSHGRQSLSTARQEKGNAISARMQIRLTMCPIGVEYHIFS
jgi:hypothetical protein